MKKKTLIIFLTIAVISFFAIVVLQNKKTETCNKLGALDNCFRVDYDDNQINILVVYTEDELGSSFVSEIAPRLFKELNEVYTKNGIPINAKPIYFGTDIFKDYPPERLFTEEGGKTPRTYQLRRIYQEDDSFKKEVDAVAEKQNADIVAYISPREGFSALGNFTNNIPSFTTGLNADRWQGSIPIFIHEFSHLAGMSHSTGFIFGEKKSACGKNNCSRTLMKTDSNLNSPTPIDIQKVAMIFSSPYKLFSNAKVFVSNGYATIPSWTYENFDMTQNSQQIKKEFNKLDHQINNNLWVGKKNVLSLANISMENDHSKKPWEWTPNKKLKLVPLKTTGGDCLDYNKQTSSLEISTAQDCSSKLAKWIFWPRSWNKTVGYYNGAITLAPPNDNLCIQYKEKQLNVFNCTEEAYGEWTYRPIVSNDSKNLKQFQIIYTKKDKIRVNNSKVCNSLKSVPVNEKVTTYCITVFENSLDTCPCVDILSPDGYKQLFDFN
ncbi:hypothetical protein HQ571_06475 [Candidatus Kuenenbacteria bacterium]|nr:hypothetical protein [Candidatus Kuenenbacteria bacterium]